MKLDHYVIATVLGSLVIAGSAFPLLLATLVAWWSGSRPRHKRAFIVTASIIVLGAGGLLSLLSLPFELFDTYISPQLRYVGYDAVPTMVGWFLTATSWVPYVAVAVGSVVIPVILRRRLWERLLGVMANNPLQPIAPTIGAAAER